MKLTQKFLSGVIAFSALLPLIMPSQAYAQQYRTTQDTPRIDGFNVKEVNRLRPGVELEFGLYGSPGGQATLRIAGATHNLVLVEVEPGQYEGTYTISSRDRLDARSPVTANLRVGYQVTSAVLNESLQIGVGYHASTTASGPQPRIERMMVEPIADLRGGNDLRFVVNGTPGGKMDLAINGVKGKIFLSEVREGEYATTYTIRNRDRITSSSAVTANLRVGERVTSAILGRSLQAAGVVNTTPVATREVRICNSCGIVEAVNPIEVRGEGNYLGSIGGGVVGALLGSQVGGGNGRTAAEIAGAVGGAYAGREIERNSRKTIHYEVRILLQNGARQTITFANDPGYRVGEKVQVMDGVISRNP